MDEVQEAAVVEGNLAGATTRQEILSAIQGFGSNAVNIAIKRSGGAGGGLPTGWTQDGSDPATLQANAGNLDMAGGSIDVDGGSIEMGNGQITNAHIDGLTFDNNVDAGGNAIQNVSDLDGLDEIDFGNNCAIFSTGPHSLELQADAGGTIILNSPSGGLSLFAGADDIGITNSAGTITLSASGTLGLQGASIALQGNLGFYGTSPIAKQTGVAVTAAAIHAALVNLGLIAA